MAGIRVSKIFNANVYLDGVNSLIGRADEVELPDIEVETEDHKGLGMVGKLKLPSGLKELKAKIKWSGFYAEHLKAGANPFRAHALQLRGSVETYDAGGRVEELPVVVFLTASWTKAGLGKYEAQKAVAFEDELAVTYVKVVHDGKEVLEVDVLQNIWRVDGEDVLARYRANIGG